MNEKKIQQLLGITDLSRIKYYLYDSILKCLRSYYKDLSINAKLTDMLRDMEVLHKKALFEQCKKLLKKVKKLAEKENKHLNLHPKRPPLVLESSAKPCKISNLQEMNNN